MEVAKNDASKQISQDHLDAYMLIELIADISKSANLLAEAAKKAFSNFEKIKEKIL